MYKFPNRPNLCVARGRLDVTVKMLDSGGILLLLSRFSLPHPSIVDLLVSMTSVCLGLYTTQATLDFSKDGDTLRLLLHPENSSATAVLA